MTKTHIVVKCHPLGNGSKHRTTYWCGMEETNELFYPFEDSECVVFDSPGAGHCRNCVKAFKSNHNLESLLRAAAVLAKLERVYP